ncbi:hypothetical protein DEIPH_ctg052orf0054 [Deinococcus phoenicis]|uniref:IrrE N-terminal-like domain-containing protein n=1 Tax=Deinococcus phoenicis TaxID=1476583 RepID=A0A016QM71_9DEIO|nr:hypothetical protein [Deinococcus phoenicis]EYB67056.1 hypothetical protein DEIPH_ctg052orf0054 [Deinococcus phoenicis]
MIDDVIHSLLRYTEARGTEAAPSADMPALADGLGYTLAPHERSFFDPLTGTAYIKRTRDPLQYNSDAGHELAHALALEAAPGSPSYRDVVRRYHAQVPDLLAHEERLTDHAGDVLTMPPDLVRVTLDICGVNAIAVWVLHQAAQVRLHEALRRVVHFNLDGRAGGFIGYGGRITHASSYRYRLPPWVGDPVPDEDEFQGEGVSLFQVPGRRNTVIGLIVIEE